MTNNNNWHFNTVSSAKPSYFDFIYFSLNLTLNRIEISKHRNKPDFLWQLNKQGHASTTTKIRGAIHHFPVCRFVCVTPLHKPVYDILYFSRDFMLCLAYLTCGLSVAIKIVLVYSWKVNIFKKHPSMFDMIVSSSNFNRFNLFNTIFFRRKSTKNVWCIGKTQIYKCLHSKE